MTEVFELNSEMITARINGTEYTYREPSADEVKDLHKKLTEIEARPEGEAIDIDFIGPYKGFFRELGLDPVALKPLSPKKILELFSYTVGAKKNSTSTT